MANPQQVYIISQSPPPPSQPGVYYASRPQPTAYPTQIQGAPPNVTGTYALPDHSGQWRDGLCDCFSNIFPSCFMSFFFQCVILGQVSENIHFAPCGFICCGYIGFVILFLILGGYYFGLQVLIWVCVGFLIWGIRNQLRNTQRIPGNPCEDCLVSFFCQGCAVSQMARHLFKYRETCDEISCSNDGRPSYFSQLPQNQTAGSTPSWQNQPNLQPHQVYTQPHQPQVTTASYTSPYAPQQQQPQYGQPSVSKAGWQENIGGAAATPYNSQNSGVINPSGITLTASPAPQYPTIVTAQPIQQSNYAPRYNEQDGPV